MSQHGVEEWSQNYLDILDARADRPMLVPGSVLPTLLHTSNIERDSGIYLDLDTARATVFDSHDAILATDIKPSYTRWLFPGFFTFPIPRNTIEFTCIADHPQAAALGIWFGHCRTVTFRDIDIVVEYADNSSRSYGILDVEHNGLRIADNQIAFMSNGPWIKIPCASPHNPAVKIRVQFYFDRFIDDEILHGSNLVLKAQNKLRSLIHGKRSRKD